MESPEAGNERSREVHGREAATLRRKRLAEWFEGERRSFPWREGLTPWGTFLAEMLLRRTRADQVARNLPAVLDRYPGPKEMAEASVEELQDALRPFGLYWRARTLHAAAAKLVLERSATVPSTAEALMTLPGVGPYVAASTAAAVGDTDVLLVDTNTVRVATRVAGCFRRGDIRRKQDVNQAIADLLGGPAPASAWWSVLDLAAAVCVPHQPSCPACPIRELCATGLSAEL